eukprot:446316-Rhodomonas_salina.3
MRNYARDSAQDNPPKVKRHPLLSESPTPPATVRAVSCELSRPSESFNEQRPRFNGGLLVGSDSRVHSEIKYKQPPFQHNLSHELPRCSLCLTPGES